MGNILVFFVELVFGRTPSLLTGALAVGVSALLGYMVTRRIALRRGVRLLGISAVALTVGAVAAYKAGNAKFDPEGWLANGASRAQWPITYSTRERMVEDLLENILPAITIDEAKRILGPSDETNEQNVLSYVVGPHPIIDDVVLVLTFGKDGRFEKYGWRNN